MALMPGRRAAGATQLGTRMLQSHRGLWRLTDCAGGPLPRGIDEARAGLPGQPRCGHPDMVEAVEGR